MENAKNTVLDLDAHWRPLDPAASEIFYTAKLSGERQLPAEERNRSFEIELLTQIARSQGCQQRHDEAEATLKEAELLMSEPNSKYSISAQIRFLLERGRLFILENTPARARPMFSKAWTLAVNSGEDFFTVDLACMMATIEPQKSQEEWIEKGIQIAEASPQEKARRLLGGLYAALAWKFYDLRQYERALETHQKSLSHFRNHGTDREIFLARWAAGRVLRQMNRNEEALTIQQALLAELGAQQAPDEGRLYEELAECLHSLKKTDEAEMYFERAFRALSSVQWVSDNQPLKLKRLKTMGKVT